MLVKCIVSVLFQSGDGCISMNILTACVGPTQLFYFSDVITECTLIGYLAQ